MSSVERFRFVLYASAIFLAIISSIFVFFYSFRYAFFFWFFGIDVFFGLAILFSCAYHWRQQSQKTKILTNVGRIFFWSLIVTRVMIAMFFVLAFTGGSSSWMS